MDTGNSGVKLGKTLSLPFSCFLFLLFGEGGEGRRCYSLACLVILFYAYAKLQAFCLEGYMCVLLRCY